MSSNKKNNNLDSLDFSLEGDLLDEKKEIIINFLIKTNSKWKKTRKIDFDNVAIEPIERYYYIFGIKNKSWLIQIKNKVLNKTASNFEKLMWKDFNNYLIEVGLYSAKKFCEKTQRDLLSFDIVFKDKIYFLININHIDLKTQQELPWLDIDSDNFFEKCWDEHEKLFSKEIKVTKRRKLEWEKITDWGQENIDEFFDFDDGYIKEFTKTTQISKDEKETTITIKNKETSQKPDVEIDFKEQTTNRIILLMRTDDFKGGFWSEKIFAKPINFEEYQKFVKKFNANQVKKDPNSFALETDSPEKKKGKLILCEFKSFQEMDEFVKRRERKVKTKQTTEIENEVVKERDSNE